MKAVVFSSLGSGVFELPEVMKTWAELKSFLKEQGLFNEGMKNAFKVNSGTEGQFTDDEQLLGDVELITMSLLPEKVSSGTDWDNPFDESNFEYLEEDYLTDLNPLILQQLLNWKYANLKAFAKYFRRHLVANEDEAIASEIGSDYMNQEHTFLAMRVANAYNAFVKKYAPVTEDVTSEFTDEVPDNITILSNAVTALHQRMFEVEFRMGIVNDYNQEQYEEVAKNLK
jgi:hypothetical protein